MDTNTLALLIALILRIASALLFLFLSIPLQVKEFNVKNGLRVLRIQLLSIGIIFFTVDVTTAILLFVILTDNIPNLPTGAIIQLTNAIGNFLVAIIVFLIYHTQYSEKSKERHAKIDKLNSSNE